MTYQPSFQLWKRQGEYFDIPTSNLTPSQIRDNLAALAGEVIGKDKTAAVRDLLTNKTTPNGGVDVTNDLKYTGMSIHKIKSWDDFQTPRIQSSSAGRMASISPLPSFGMVSLPTRSRVAGARRSGRSTSRRKFLFEEPNCKKYADVMFACTFRKEAKQLVVLEKHGCIPGYSATV